MTTDEELLVRIVTPRFCAGVVFGPDHRAAHTAPCFKHLRGKKYTEVIVWALHRARPYHVEAVWPDITIDVTGIHERRERRRR